MPCNAFAPFYVCENVLYLDACCAYYDVCVSIFCGSVFKHQRYASHTVPRPKTVYDNVCDQTYSYLPRWRQSLSSRWNERSTKLKRKKMLKHKRSLVCTVILHYIMYFGVVIPAHSLPSGENYASISHLETSLVLPLVARREMLSFLFQYCFCVNHSFLPHRRVVSDFTENSMPRTRNRHRCFQWSTLV